MSYKGLTYRIPCDRGGFTYNPNVAAIEPFMMVDPSRNINMHKGGREPRGGTEHVNGAAVSGTPSINGLFDYTNAIGTQFLPLGTSDGKALGTPLP